MLASLWCLIHRFACHSLSQSMENLTGTCQDTSPVKAPGDYNVQPSYCTAPLVSLHKPCWWENQVSTNIGKKFGSNELGTDQVWSLKQELSPADQGRASPSSPLCCLWTAELPLQLIKHFRKEGPQHLLPVQEFITSTGNPFNQQQPSVPKITDAQKCSSI